MAVESAKVKHSRLEIEGRICLFGSMMQNEADPYALFQKWYGEASGKAPAVIRGIKRTLSKLFQASNLFEPNAIALATATAQGRPSVRMVLFKGMQPDGGFSFYTNLKSQKAQELKDNPQAAIVFYWAFPPRQVRIEGKVELLSWEESSEYWKTRPRGSQLGALASDQSHPIQSKDEMRERYRTLEKEYQSKEIPCPEHWRGFSLNPERFEFWQGQPDRMHDRVRFDRDVQPNEWTRSLLAP